MATQFNRPPLRRITDFKSKLVGGGARPNLFEVELAFPEEIAIDNENRISPLRTRQNLKKAEDLHKSALNLARQT